MVKQLNPTNIAVLTSGGDAPGMNSALRAVVRTGINRGVDVYAIYEGYRGMVEGGDRIKKMDWNSVGGIMHQGGTMIGSARCQEFREREGRLQAAKHLVERGINRLIVIGGDGSLTGANVFREEWVSLLSELVDRREITRETADQYPDLILAGLVGSIDNDMFGTDMTIGADTALHRIIDAVDAITSTASSHQRSFVVEVMGRNCGYLALMSAIAAGANWVLIPEYPPEADNWEEEMCETLRSGRERGRRASIVIVAEGAKDRDGKAITSNYVKEVLEDRIGEDTRVTVLGHVQRGGSPSAFERYMSTLLGYAAVDVVLNAPDDYEPQVIGIREHRVTQSPLMECVNKTREVAKRIEAHDYEEAMRLRGGSFMQTRENLRIINLSKPMATTQKRSMRLAILHASGPAPGMNTAVRVAVRLACNEGHQVMAVRNGFDGLMDGNITELDWMSISGWVSRGGAELGTSRLIPTDENMLAIANQLEAHSIDGILMIGGWSGYRAVHKLSQCQDKYSALNIPMVCVPASINNNLPASEQSIGADTALNNIITDVDKIKQSAVASGRVFVVEVMGRDCGYLALLSGIATGAERIYLPEEGVTLRDLKADVDNLIESFEHGTRLGLMIRNEQVDKLYTTEFMCALFEKESGDLFDVRPAILGHTQQGGNPSPYDRIQAIRLTSNAVRYLIEQVEQQSMEPMCLGVQGSRLAYTPLSSLTELANGHPQRPHEQWWLSLREIADVMANQPH